MNSYISSDYAGFDSNNLKVYYGYEEVNPNDEDDICFVAEFSGKRVVIPFSELSKNNCLKMWDISGCILEGLCKLFDKYELVEKLK